MFALRAFRDFSWLSHLLGWQQTKGYLARSYVFVLKIAVLSGSPMYDLTWWTDGRYFIKAQRKHCVMFALRAFREFPWLSHLLDLQHTKSSLALCYVFVLKVGVLSGSHISDLMRWTDGRDYITAQRKHAIMFALRAFREFQWLSHPLDWQQTKSSLVPSYVFVLKVAVLSESPIYDLQLTCRHGLTLINIQLSSKCTGSRGYDIMN